MVCMPIFIAHLLSVRESKGDGSASCAHRDLLSTPTPRLTPPLLQETGLCGGGAGAGGGWPCAYMWRHLLLRRFLGPDQGSVVVGVLQEISVARDLSCDHHWPSGSVSGCCVVLDHWAHGGLEWGLGGWGEQRAPHQPPSCCKSGFVCPMRFHGLHCGAYFGTIQTLKRYMRPLTLHVVSCPNALTWHGGGGAVQRLD